MIIEADFQENNKVLDADFGTVYSVDTAIGDISTALDELHEYAQALIGGVTE